MRSLRGRLLISLWIVISVVGVISAGISYRQVSREMKELLDNQLTQVARTAMAQTDVPVGPEGRDSDNIEVAVWASDGTLQYASWPQMRFLPPRRQGFTEMILGGEPFRIYGGKFGSSFVQVAQPVDTRDDQAEEAALAAFLPLLLLLPLLALVIALVVRSLLAPVRSTTELVARRDPLDGQALPVRDLPMEVAPLVEEINRLLERQRDAVLRERQFIADAAHALRTPLAALQLQADVLDGSTDPTERVTRLTELRAGIARSARLSAQLLSMAKIDIAPKAPGEWLDLEAVLLELKALYEPAAAARRVTLELGMQANIRMHADHARLMLIFGNLLDNALRYSPPQGRIEMVVDVQSDSVSIEVRDEGPGLAPEQFERVFERFYRAPGEPAGGSGLGLATVKSLVEQLGGRVSLHNRTDRTGLTARVEVPLEQADALPRELTCAQRAAMSA